VASNLPTVGRVRPGEPRPTSWEHVGIGSLGTGSPYRSQTEQNPPLKVLLVEDNPGDAWLLRDLLNRAGARNFQIVHVETLKAALEQMRESEPDIILLDLSLPDAHGQETVTLSPDFHF